MGNSNRICKFCQIIEEKKEILYEDEHFVLFADIKPIAKIHLQAVPKKHIKNINELNKEEITLLEHMKEKSRQYFLDNYGEIADISMGFHIPPFYSISHLHMHCILPPYKSNFRQFFAIKVFRSVDNQIEKLKSKS